MTVTTLAAVKSPTNDIEEQLRPRNDPGITHDDDEERRRNSPRNFVATLIEYAGQSIDQQPKRFIDHLNQKQR